MNVSALRRSRENLLKKRRFVMKFRPTMKIRPNVASLAALTLGIAMAVASPAFAQSVPHHNTQRTGSAESRQKIQYGQPGYSRGPLYNYVPQQQPGLQCEAPLSPAGAGAGASSCGGPGYNPSPKQ
jgi:hypothetical protein